jgi:hypothetical protein
MSQMENQLVVVNIYKPVFNNQTLKYEDVNPIPPRTRGRQYKCLCKHSKVVYTTTSQLNQHLDTKDHIRYVQDYEENIKEVSDAQELIKQLKIQLLMERQTSLMKIKTLEDENKKIKIENEWLNQKFSDRSLSLD